MTFFRLFFVAGTRGALGWVGLDGIGLNWIVLLVCELLFLMPMY